MLEPTNNMDDNHKLKWRFDVSTFRLIGRDLITDRVTALFELVKNCYDANAQNVNVIFENVGAGKKQAVIRVEDDGYGMSFEDIRDKWMVIGTSSKRARPYYLWVLTCCFILSAITSPNLGGTAFPI
jgi:sensor histidine kinase regulating citrate/malate metabolism